MVTVVSQGALLKGILQQHPALSKAPHQQPRSVCLRCTQKYPRLLIVHDWLSHLNVQLMQEMNNTGVFEVTHVVLTFY